MNRILDMIEKILTMFFAVTYFLGIVAVDSIFIHIFIIAISVFTFCTSIVDIIRYKKRDIKITILNILLILILLLNIYRPFIDSILIKNLSLNFEMKMYYSVDLLCQNFLLITIFMIILFILNFKIKKYN